MENNNADHKKKEFSLETKINAGFGLGVLSGLSIMGISAVGLVTSIGTDNPTLLIYNENLSKILEAYGQRGAEIGLYFTIASIAGMVVNGLISPMYKDYNQGKR